MKIHHFAIFTILLLVFSPVNAQSVTLEPITSENISRLEQLKIIGRGELLDATFTPDGKSLVIGTSAGVWFYDSENLSAEPHYLNRGTGFAGSVKFDKTGEYLEIGSYYPDVGAWTSTWWRLNGNFPNYVPLDEDIPLDAGPAIPSDGTFSPGLIVHSPTAEFSAVNAYVEQGYRGRELRLFNLYTRQYQASIHIDETREAEFSRSTFSHDGKYLITTTWEYVSTMKVIVRLWSIDELLQKQRLLETDGRVIWEGTSLTRVTVTGDLLLIEKYSPDYTTQITEVLHLPDATFIETLVYGKILIHPPTGDIILLNQQFMDTW